MRWILLTFLFPFFLVSAQSYITGVLHSGEQTVSRANVILQETDNFINAGYLL